MKPGSLTRGIALMLLPLLLVACGGGGDDDVATDAPGVALVTTTLPVQRRFHDRVAAWGSVAADPHAARSISLAHAGQVVALAVSAGQSVRRGQPLLTMAPDPTARSALQQAQAAATLATGELQRTAQLAAQHLATQSQVAAARKALADARSALAAQQALGGGAAQETVTAPDAGVITSVAVTRGERVAANAPLLGFMPAHAVVAVLGVQPDAGATLVAGMPVQMHDVYGGGKGVTGTLVMVGHAIDPQTRLLPLQASLPAGPGLVPGAAIEASIERDTFTAWAVPRAAVLHDAQGNHLFQLDHGKARRVDVQVRQPDGDTLGVTGKLDAALPVIVDGAYEVDDGAAVREGTP